MTKEVIEAQWNAYFSAFGTVADEERDRLLEQCVSEDLVFTNPGGSGKTRLGLTAHIEDFRRKMPGMYFGTDKLFFQEKQFLAIWSMYKPDQTKVATGYNFVTLDDDGKFNYMAGFF